MKSSAAQQNDQNMDGYVVPQPFNNTNQNTEPYQNLETRDNTKRQNFLFCFATDNKNIVIVILATLLAASIAITVFLVLRDGKDESDQQNPDSNGIENRWTLWGSWGQCSCWNGTTTQQRHRFCMSTMENQELHCPGPNIETQNCLSSITCLQDGWSDWSSWGQCSCWNGTATRQRFRFCSSRNTKQQELYCSGPDVETQNCLSSVQCFQDGWTDWSSWGQCSCWNGTATRQRFRFCSSMNTKQQEFDCPGTDIETQNCLSSVTCFASNENGWSDWSSWGRCSCWNGTTTQQRL